MNPFFNNRLLNIWRDLLAIMSWSIWLSMNSSLFDGKVIPPSIISSLTKARIEECISISIAKSTKVIGTLQLDKSKCRPFFGSASQDSDRKCSIAFIMFLDDNSSFHFKENMGAGSINRGELLACFYLPKLAYGKGIQVLHIFGYLVLVINHFQGSTTISCLILAYLTQ